MPTDAQLLHAAQTYGTPLYAYDAAELDASWARAQRAFEGERLFYAMKANPNLTLLRQLLSAGAGFECVSAGELGRAAQVGAPGSHILVNGPAKSAQEYRLGAELGATFIVDRAEEVALLPPRSLALVRVNPALAVSTHDHLATGAGASKFGVLLSEVVAVISALNAAGHTARGLHVHIGSAIRDAHDFGAAFAKLTELRSLTGELEVLDIGGGWSLDADLDAIAAQARHLANSFKAQLWAEPGRYLVAGAGSLLSSVVGSKHTARPYLLLDAGMTELLRPMLYGAAHPVRALWSRAGEGTYDLAGPACESGDVLARNVRLPSPQPGDVLAFLETGAYGAAMSSTYLSRGRPAEVLLEKGQWRLIRRRDTPQDLWAAEL